MKKLGLIVILAVACLSALIPLAVGASGAAISSEVNFANIKAGTPYTVVIQVKNTDTVTADFDVFYQAPGFSKVGEAPTTAVAKGYTNIGDEAQGWVTIGNGVDAGQTFTVTIAAGKAADVPVTLLIPNGVNDLPAKWAFWITAKENTDGNMIYQSSCTCLVGVNHSNILPFVIGGVFVVALLVVVFLLRGGDKTKK